jgi:hypothetical protein
MLEELLKLIGFEQAFAAYPGIVNSAEVEEREVA